MPGKGARERAKAKQAARLEASIIKCPNCGHAEYVHFMFVGACLHGQMKPKDKQDCHCQQVSLIKGENK